MLQVVVIEVIYKHGNYLFLQKMMTSEIQNDEVLNCRQFGMS